MLADHTIHPTLPASDIERAKAWYRDILGMTPTQDNPGGVTYQAGGITFMVFPTENAGTAKNTAAEFIVDDVEAEVDELIAKGVVFEQYKDFDMPTDDKGISRHGPMAIAWFKDSEGNILAVRNDP